jgi:hypothetical protein
MMGRPSRRAGTHASDPVQGFHKGWIPHLPFACDAKVVAATIGVRPRRLPGRTRQWGALLAALCPCTALTACLQPPGPSPSRRLVALGFSPSWVRRRGRRGVGGEGKGEEERGRGSSACDAAGAPRPEAVRVGGEPGQSKRWGTTVNTYTAPPTSSSRQRLPRRPDVSRPAALPSLAMFPFLDLSCGHAFEPSCTMRAAPPFLHRRLPRHAAHVRTRHRGHLRPQRWALSVASRRVIALFVKQRTTTRCVVVPCAVRVSCLVFLWSAFVPWWFCAGKRVSRR